MNVIAAMPLESAKSLLALYDGGAWNCCGACDCSAEASGQDDIEVDNDGHVSEHTYEMFVDCTGQGLVDIDRFPFPNMIQRGVAVEASAPLRDPQSIDDFDEELRNNVLDGSPARLKLGGIAIDGYFRVIGADGQSNPRYLISRFHTPLAYAPIRIWTSSLRYYSCDCCSSAWRRPVNGSSLSGRTRT